MDGKLDDGSPTPPNLQVWINHYDGLRNIPWDKWDAAIAEYQRERRAVFVAEIEANKLNRCLATVQNNR